MTIFYLGESMHMTAKKDYISPHIMLLSVAFESKLCMA